MGRIITIIIVGLIIQVPREMQWWWVITIAAILATITIMEIIVITIMEIQIKPVTITQATY